MLYPTIIPQENELNILILLVIAFILIVTVFVGYNVTQRESLEGHSITIDLEILSEHESIQLFTKSSALYAIT
jgi:hypothetical protein